METELVVRVLILGINYAPECTGIAPYTTKLAHHLAENHDVTVLTGLPHYPDWVVPVGHRRWRHDARDDGVRIVRLRHYVPSAPTAVRRAAYELSWASRVVAAGARIRTDLVISIVPALFGAHAGAAIARHQRVPLGVIVQDVMSTAAAQSGARGGRYVSRVTGALERSAMLRASSVITIHPRLAAELERITVGQVVPEVICNWTQISARSAPGRSLRDRYGWHNNELIALHSGNMGAKQNLEVVIDAARLAQHEQRPVRFVLAGGGSQSARLAAYARDCHNVQFIPSVDDGDYLDLLDSADALVINERPGVRDMSLPSKLTSYLIADRPIVAAVDEDSATADFVRASGGGVVTPAGDAGSLLEAVEKLGADESMCRQMVDAGQAFAASELSEARAFKAFDDWVKQLSTARAV